MSATGVGVKDVAVLYQRLVVGCWRARLADLLLTSCAADAAPPEAPNVG